MKQLYVILFLLLFTLTSSAQGTIEKKRSLSDNLYFGGGLGLQFGSVTGIEISPTVAYQFSDNILGGVKTSFEYYKTEWYETSIYGGSLYGMYNFYDNFLLYAEVEALNYIPGHFVSFSSNLDREWVVSPLVGPGFMQPIGERAKLLLMLLWNLNDSSTSPYSNPIVRVTFLF